MALPDESCFRAESCIHIHNSKLRSLFRFGFPDYHLFCFELKNGKTNPNLPFFGHTEKRNNEISIRFSFFRLSQSKE